MSKLKPLMSSQTEKNLQPRTIFWEKVLKCSLNWLSTRYQQYFRLPVSISCLWLAKRNFISLDELMCCLFFSWFSFILYQLLCSRFLIRDFHLFHFLPFAFAFTFLSNQVCACVFVCLSVCVHTWQNISTYVVTTFNCNFWCTFLVFRSHFHRSLAHLFCICYRCCRCRIAFFSFVVVFFSILSSFQWFFPCHFHIHTSIVHFIMCSWLVYI